ncbi:Conserved Cysteine/Glycine domain protein [Ditylenchus destructor]|uniref:Conserved Cysteine/Glycine domain protein n=1 Tax=Ditylenchus destructor TaxID=166010 RepID=A0AAD4RCE5_9BILA|nr:Conserved Cysteine/Glycine domain protein [Ditylenchus destructor]
MSNVLTSLFFYISLVFAVNALIIEKRDTAAIVKDQFADFRENCGCKCTITNVQGGEDIITFSSYEMCKKPVEVETAENKKSLNEEITKKFANFRENCFPRGSGHGCKCTTTDSNGQEEVITFGTDDKCKKPVEFQTAENKKALNEEFKQKYGGLKENCFPRPGKGCRCNEKDANGQESEKLYESDADCKTLVTGRVRRQSGTSQNVRDPVRERAQQNYAAVINELKDKFKGLKEGCYPRPKGCLCVIGKDSEGRDITERRMKDSDCKCQPNERSRECPAPGA